MINEQQIVLASNNPGKVKEINGILEGTGINVVPQAQLNVEDAIEDGLSFIENALIKARHATAKTGLPAIADDSGLEVMALDGEPGIYSARYAGEKATDRDNLVKLVERVKTLPENKRRARFVCVMVYLRHVNDPVPIISQGLWDGCIVTEPEGDNGFGYDPIFYVNEYQCTAAGLKPDVKNRISHRGQALAGLMAALEQELKSEGQ